MPDEEAYQSKTVEADILYYDSPRQQPKWAALECCTFTDDRGNVLNDSRSQGWEKKIVFI